MRPLEHHELSDVAHAVTDELDDHVDVAVEEASLGLGQQQRGATHRLRGELSTLGDACRREVAWDASG